MATKYLYGASVQGIQSFIFQTNELKDIVGASELVDSICKEVFDDFAKGGESILRAAGNIKHIFDDKKSCERAVRNFPRKVMNTAPGITISQAVVEYTDDDFGQAVEALEKKLRAQRNRPMRSQTVGLMGTERSRKTGLPATSVKKNEHIDAGTEAKRNFNEVHKLCKTNFGKKDLSDSQLAYNISDITKHNDWIAVVHADGNGLGQVVRKIGKNEESLSDFSDKLDDSTKRAAVLAFEEICRTREIDVNDKKEVIPFRPIVLSGDDHTIICRADLAVEYTAAFIRNFEEQTHENLGDMLMKANVFEEGKVRDRLTACAGIAFIKSSYPFYYGYRLAEALCDYAKKDAKSPYYIYEGKEIAPSCLMFHKVQDSFVTSYSVIAERELRPSKNASFQYGPYYINSKECYWTVNELIETTNKLNDTKEGNALKSNLRQWMSAMHESEKMAAQRIDRTKSLLREPMLSLANKLSEEVMRHGEPTKLYPTYDVLALNSIMHQITK